MTTYQELTQGPITAEFKRRAVLGTYNGTEISVIFRVDDPERKNTTTQATTAEVATVVVLRSAVPAPQYQDKIMVEGRTWTVMQPQSGGGFHTHKLLVERNRGRVRR